MLLSSKQTLGIEVVAFCPAASTAAVCAALVESADSHMCVLAFVFGTVGFVPKKLCFSAPKR